MITKLQIQVRYVQFDINDFVMSSIYAFLVHGFETMHKHHRTTKSPMHDPKVRI